MYMGWGTVFLLCSTHSKNWYFFCKKLSFFLSLSLSLSLFETMAEDGGVDAAVGGEEDDEGGGGGDWRYSSLFPAETRASRWASKLVFVTTPGRQHIGGGPLLSREEEEEEKKSRFQTLLERCRVHPTKTTSETLAQIEKDLPRTGSTFENCGLSKPGDKMWDALKHILLAFAAHDPATGYVQSMNFICAFFLLSGMDEENAFWCLDGLVNRIVPGYFTEGMAKAMEDQRVFSRVVNKIEPELGVHLDALGADNIVSAITSSQWLLTLFVNVLPTRCTFRVWDRVIESGHRAPLFAASCALLGGTDAKKKLLEATEMGEAVERLQSLGKEVGKDEKSMEKFESRFDRLCEHIDGKFIEVVEAEVLEEEGDVTTCLKRAREEMFRKVCSEDVLIAMEICKKQQRKIMHSSNSEAENENSMKLEKNMILGKTTVASFSQVLFDDLSVVQAATEQEEEEELVDELESLDGDFVSDDNDDDDDMKRNNNNRDVNTSKEEYDVNMDYDFDRRVESKQQKQQLNEDEIPPKAGITIEASVAIIECILSLERELRVCVSDTASRGIAQLTTEAALVSVRAVSSIDLAVQREILVQELKDFREGYEECLKRDALDLSKVQVDRQALAWLNETRERGERLLFQMSVVKKVLRIILTRAKLVEKNSDTVTATTIDPETGTPRTSNKLGVEKELSPTSLQRRIGLSTSPSTMTTTTFNSASRSSFDGRMGSDSRRVNNYSNISSNNSNNDNDNDNNNNKSSNNNDWEDIEKSELTEINEAEKIELIDSKELDKTKLENDRLFAENIKRVQLLVEKTRENARTDLETLRSFYESKKTTFSREDVRGKTAIENWSEFARKSRRERDATCGKKIAAGVETLVAPWEQSKREAEETVENDALDGDIEKDLDLMEEATKLTDEIEKEDHRLHAARSTMNAIDAMISRRGQALEREMELFGRVKDIQAARSRLRHSLLNEVELAKEDIELVLNARIDADYFQKSIDDSLEKCKRIQSISENALKTMLLAWIKFVEKTTIEIAMHCVSVVDALVEVANSDAQQWDAAIKEVMKEQQRQRELEAAKNAASGREHEDSPNLTRQTSNAAADFLMSKMESLNASLESSKLAQNFSKFKQRAKENVNEFRQQVNASGDSSRYTNAEDSSTGGDDNTNNESLMGKSTPKVSTPKLLVKMISNAAGTPRESKHLVKLKEEAARVDQENQKLMEMKRSLRELLMER